MTTNPPPEIDDSHTIQQLAMYSQRIDVMENGPVDDDGKPLTSWADIGEIGQEEYLKDAERTVKIVRLLGWISPQQYQVQP
jgi:hypothetical protein